MVFSNDVTINGTMRILTGSTVEVWGMVVNNGVLDLSGGGMTNLHGGFVNNGIIFTGETTNSWISSTNGYWDDDTNWTVGIPDRFWSAMFITNENSKTVTADFLTRFLSFSTLTVSNLTIGAPAGYTNTLLLDVADPESPLTLVDYLNIESGGSVFLDYSGIVATNTDLFGRNKGVFVGNASGNASLVISNASSVLSANAILGNSVSSSNNVAPVVRYSTWTNSLSLLVGNNGAGNQLIVTSNSVVSDLNGLLGWFNSSSNNLAIVSGTGSLWQNNSTLSVGANGAGNTLIVTNGGTVLSSPGYLGQFASSSNNVAIVTGAGSVWNCSPLGLFVGYSGADNQLIAADSGSVIATNVSGTSQLDVQRGELTLDDGTIEADQLLATNGNKSVVNFNGGTLATRSTTVANGQRFVVGNGTSPAALNLQGNGLHNFNNGLTISAFGTLTGNGTVNGDVTVAGGGTLSPGTSIGTITLITLSNSPTLLGNLALEISKTGTTLTNDQLKVMAPLAYSGILTVSNLGPDALSEGDSFRLFSASNYGGSFTSINLPPLASGLTWTNHLLDDGSIAVVSQTPPVIGSMTQSGSNLVFAISGGSPGGAYDLLTSTNIAIPVNRWTTNSSGNFDWMGNLILTNSVGADEPQRFFLLRMP